MSEDYVIQLTDVSKAYRVYRRMSDVLKEGFLGGERHDLFWALRNISFAVREGERIGIIGSNGAGKSTLLKLITGNLTPSSGSVVVDGRISALLSLIPALRREESGLENIKLNLLMSGANRRDIPSMVDEIVDFTELSSFIYQPVRTYSSGMQARLAFAVATSVTPEILIIDEVLGTGDAYFQSKAEARMRELCGRGKALLFVSHATQAIRNLCDRVLWLENGEIRMDSSADYVVTQYEEDAKRQQDQQTRRGNIEDTATREAGVGSSVDLFADGVVHLRLVAADVPRFHHTHYVCAPVVRINGGPEIPVPLEMVDIDNSDAPAALALLGTEWGRVHRHLGRQCRELSAKIGRLKGGVVSLRDTGPAQAQSVNISLQFDADCERSEETLLPEYFDITSREWIPLRSVPAAQSDGQWKPYAFEADIPRATRTEIEESREHFEREIEPAAAIDRVILSADGNTTTTVVEHVAFELTVYIAIARRVPLLDVCLKLTRSDGVHVFWQSSGFADGGYRNVEANFSASFVFDPNVLGPGTYQASVVLGNGWDLQNNYPHSKIYYRKINALEFTVRREHGDLDLGVINVVVPVTRSDHMLTASASDTK